MCGILAVLGIKNANSLRSHIVELSSRLRHRGPDWSGLIVQGDCNIYAHERLALIGLLSGEQPIVSTDKKYVITVNGEIYNYIDLMKTSVKGNY